jgi:hypothetical protein
MKLKVISAAISTVAAISLLGATSATAATEFGDNCSGSGPTGAPVTLFEISSTNNPLPTAAPVSGVITKMKVNLASGAPVFPVSLKVLRVLSADTLQIIGEANGNVAGGATSIDARIPVQAGDRLGFFSPSSFGAIICEEATGDSILGAYEGGGSVGGTATYGSGPAGGTRVPVFASIEPDVDNDGFGDETQDACPQSATTQVACPPVTLSTTKQVRKGSVVIVVTASTAAPVTVKGVVKLGKGKKAKLNGGTKNLTPGVLGKFTLKFTKKVKAKLAQLSPKQSLTLKATVAGTNVAGQVTTKTLKVKLKGQAKG